MSDARPMTPSLWAALCRVAGADADGCPVVTRNPGRRGITSRAAQALVARGLIRTVTPHGGGLRAYLTVGGGQAIRWHRRQASRDLTGT